MLAFCFAYTAPPQHTTSKPYFVWGKLNAYYSNKLNAYYSNWYPSYQNNCCYDIMVLDFQK